MIVEGGWRNKIAYSWMEDLGVPVMRTWNETVPLWSYHHHYHPHNPHPDCEPCTLNARPLSDASACSAQP